MPRTIGRFDNDEFAVIPELTFNVGVNLTKSMTMYVGYNFMWISHVARPGNQINPVIDCSTVPFSPTTANWGMSPGPRNLFQQDEFWLQGVNFGLNIQY